MIILLLGVKEVTDLNEIALDMNFSQFKISCRKQQSKRCCSKFNLISTLNFSCIKEIKYSSHDVENTLAFFQKIFTPEYQIRSIEARIMTKDNTTKRMSYLANVVYTKSPELKECNFYEIEIKILFKASGLFIS